MGPLEADFEFRAQNPNPNPNPNQLVAPFNIYYNARLIFQKGEVWRLVTSFLYFGQLSCGREGEGERDGTRARARARALSFPTPPDRPPSDLDFVFHMFFLVKYAKALEEGSFRGRSADFLWMLLLGGTALAAAAPLARVQFLGSSLAFMMVYVWAKRNRQDRKSVV